jgi:hypothetical protein
MPLDNPRTQPVEEWQTPTLLNAWINRGSPNNPVGYWKGTDGVVHLRGSIQSGVTNTNIFILPAGYRPPGKEVFLVLCYSSTLGYVPGRVDVFSDGTVLCQTGPASGLTVLLSLDGLTFRVA